jgi:protein involved in polysaccharide export with SLBB domain
MNMDRLWRVGVPAKNAGGRLAPWGALFLAVTVGIGCASFSNPTGPDAIPVNRLPPEVFGPSREAEKTIPLTLLRQKQPEPLVGYLLDAGDILGVFVEGVLGERGSIPPVTPVQVSLTGTPPPPAIGFPIPVQENGTIILPLIDPIVVKGKNVLAVQEAVTRAYTDGGLIAKGARILVSLAKQRTYHVTVIRQDAGVGSALNSGLVNSAAGGLVNAKRGTGYPVDLNAYENDLLNALARTGGLPGLDASSTVVIQRSGPKEYPPGTKVSTIAAESEQIRVPLRMRPNQVVPFRPEDVVLKTGDIVFIESRDTEVYYTGGVLPVAELLLPRDYDLDVMEAVTQSRGPLFNGGVNFNNLSGAIFASGLGAPSPSMLTVIRKTPKGGQITIQVDLNRCAQDTRERILVQPGDFLVLQESLGESFTRYMTQTFRYVYTGQLIHSRHVSVTQEASLP